MVLTAFYDLGHLAKRILNSNADALSRIRREESAKVMNNEDVMEALLTIKMNKVEDRLIYHNTDILNSNEKHMAICAPADFGVKSDLLRKILTKFGLIKQLRKQHKKLGDCTIRVDNFYLNTKYRNTDITNLGILENCLKKLAQISREKKIKKLALPKMQGGLDKRQWRC